MERKGIVTYKGKPVTLLGPELKVGEKAPDFTVVDRELNEVSLKEFAGKAKLISVTASLDTHICDHQARKFNEEAAKFPPEIAIMNITMDLPFAISRFCVSAGIEEILTFSDHRYASFGMNYGILIKELRLLARSIFLIDANDTIKYIQIVNEVASEVDFQKALDAANRLLARR